MAHLIEKNSITGKAEIAYAGAKPWHGLGQQPTPDASIDVWRKAMVEMPANATQSGVEETFTVPDDGIIEIDEPGICPACNGSGEGQFEGTTCYHCKGKGEV